MWVLYSQARLGGGAHDGPDAWTVEAHLLAAAVDVLNGLVWTTRALNMKNPGKPPEPLPRPGEQEPQGGPGIVPGLPVIDLRKQADDER